jgi:hypothetical protein
MTYDAGHPCCAEYGQMQREIVRLQHDLPRHQAITTRQQAEIERLRAALDQALDDMGDSHCVCHATKEMMQVAMGVSAVEQSAECQWPRGKLMDEEGICINCGAGASEACRYKP